MHPAEEMKYRNTDVHSTGMLKAMGSHPRKPLSLHHEIREPPKWSKISLYGTRETGFGHGCEASFLSGRAVMFWISSAASALSAMQDP